MSIFVCIYVSQESKYEQRFNTLTQLRRTITGKLFIYSTILTQTHPLLLTHDFFFLKVRI